MKLGFLIASAAPRLGDRRATGALSGLIRFPPHLAGASAATPRPFLVEAGDQEMAVPWPFLTFPTRARPKFTIGVWLRYVSIHATIKTLRQSIQPQLAHPAPSPRRKFSLMREDGG